MKVCAIAIVIRIRRAHSPVGMPLLIESEPGFDFGPRAPMRPSVLSLDRHWNRATTAQLAGNVWWKRREPPFSFSDVYHT